MKETITTTTYNNVFLDFPSFSSLTITSKNDPATSGFLIKEEEEPHSHSFSSTTIVSNNSINISSSTIEEKDNSKQQKKKHHQKQDDVYATTTIVTATTKKTKKNRSIIQQCKMFLANNIRPSSTTNKTNEKKQQHHHLYCNTSYNNSNNISKNNNNNKNTTRHCYYNHSRLLSKYGQLQRRQIGTGANATVRLTHQIDGDNNLYVYAVKVFKRKNNKNTTTRKENYQQQASFMKKLISEFCISSSLDHPNIVKTIDLVIDEKNRYCTIMEYCPGGDLYTFIKQGQLCTQDEINGYFKQLLNGLSYLHALGVAHRDIKPENLLLVKQTNDSILLKITDFGEADVFREAWQETSRLSDGLCGSTPYIAPEIFKSSKQGYRASQADVWSAGIVYFCMQFNGVPFYSAQLSDTNYNLYKKHYTTETYPAFQTLEQESKDMMYAMLNPDPEKRYTVQDVLKLTWLAEIKPPICIMSP